MLLTWTVCTSLEVIKENKVLISMIYSILILTRGFGQRYLNLMLRTKIVYEMLNVKFHLLAQTILQLYMKVLCTFLVGMIAIIAIMIYIKLSYEIKNIFGQKYRLKVQYR